MNADTFLPIVKIHRHRTGAFSGTVASINSSPDKSDTLKRTGQIIMYKKYM